MARIIVVEDDKRFAQPLIKQLLRMNHQVDLASNYHLALVQLSERSYDIALADLMLPPTYRDEGVTLLKEISVRYPQIQTIMMTAKQTGTTELVSIAMKNGAKFFLDKQSSQFFDNLELQIREIVMDQKSRIFLSHGHNDVLKFKLKDFITSRLKKSALILADQPSRGLTVVEKLEQASEQCEFAIVLLTKDDEQKEGGARARQNVIHEIGFFQGKLGRRNVVLLCERGVELFSNISGIVRIDFEVASFESVFEPLRIEFGK